MTLFDQPLPPPIIREPQDGNVRFVSIEEIKKEDYLTDKEVEEIGKRWSDEAREKLTDWEIDMSKMEFKVIIEPHKIENNEESQQHLNSKRKVFGGQNKAVYDFLMAGHAITVAGAINGCIGGKKISSLPRRLADLREAGYKHSDVWNEARTEKVFYMSAEDIAYNKEVAK